MGHSEEKNSLDQKIPASNEIKKDLNEGIWQKNNLAGPDVKGKDIFLGREWERR